MNFLVPRIATNPPIWEIMWPTNLYQLSVHAVTSASSVYVAVGPTRVIISRKFESSEDIMMSPAL